MHPVRPGSGWIEVVAGPMFSGKSEELIRLLRRAVQAELREESLANLQRLVGFSESYPDRRLSSEGHPDSTGSEAFNLTLSQQRAEAVRDALIDRGISTRRLEAVGLGEEFPIASNDTEVGRRQNRRVEIIILKAGEG